MQHDLMKPSDEHNCRRQDNVPGPCWLCDGGLSYCKVCEESEAALERTCPGHKSATIVPFLAR